MLFTPATLDPGVESAARVITWIAKHAGAIVGLGAAVSALFWGWRERRQRMTAEIEKKARELGELTANVADLRGDISTLGTRLENVQGCFGQQIEKALEAAQAKWQAMLATALENLRDDLHKRLDEVDTATTTLKDLQEAYGGRLEALESRIVQVEKMAAEILQSHGARLLRIEAERRTEGT